MACTPCAAVAPKFAPVPARVQAPALRRTLCVDRQPSACQISYSSSSSHSCQGKRAAVKVNAAASSGGGAAEPVKRSILVLGLLFTGWCVVSTPVREFIAGSAWAFMLSSVKSR